MARLYINNIRLYAYHGCLEEEAKIGGHYTIDVIIDADLTKAITSDDLSDTIDYCVVYEAVKREMAIRSKLIEHVAGRIAKAIKAVYPAIASVTVRLTKHVPPVNGEMGSAVVEVEG